MGSPIIGRYANRNLHQQPHQTETCLSFHISQLTQTTQYTITRIKKAMGNNSHLKNTQSTEHSFSPDFLGTLYVVQLIGERSIQRQCPYYPGRIKGLHDQPALLYQLFNTNQPLIDLNNIRKTCFIHILHPTTIGELFTSLERGSNP